MAQLDEALEAGAEGILLDNFQVRDMVDAVKRVRERRPQTVIEASGGVTLDRLHEISKTGVDVISIGSLTHSARAINYSCEIRPVEGSQPSAGLTAVAGARAVALARLDAGPMDERSMDEAPTRPRWPPDCTPAGWGGRSSGTRSAGRPTILAAERARAGAPAGLVIVADAQTAGRGRLGRTWHSPADENLYLSIVLRPARPTVGDPAHHAAGRGRRRAGAADVRPDAAAQVAERRRAGRRDRDDGERWLES